MRRNLSVVAIIATVVITSVAGIFGAQAATSTDQQPRVRLSNSVSVERRVSDVKTPYVNPIQAADVAIRRAEIRYAAALWLGALKTQHDARVAEETRKRLVSSHKPHPKPQPTGAATIPPATAAPGGHGGCSGLSNPPPGAIVANTCSWSAAANCVMNHENSARVTNRFYGSGIRLTYDGSHSASGLFQIVRSTWGGYGGYLYAAYAPASVQYARFQQLWAQSPRHWHGTGCPGT